MIFKNRNIAILIFCVTMLAVFSCNKYSKYSTNTSTLPDIAKPVVDITTPINAHQYPGMSYLSIVGTVTDRSIKTVNLHVQYVDTPIVIYNFNPTITSHQGFTINTGFYPNFKTLTNCYLIVTATDSSNNITTDTTTFSLQ